MAREVIDIIIQERGGKRVSQQVKDVGLAATAASGAVSLLRRALGGLGAGFAAREVLRAVDSYQRMQNQLRVVGFEQNQLNKALNDLYTISQRNRTPLEGTVNLFGKLAQSAGELGKTQAEMLEFTDLVGKSLAIQGTSSAGSRGALLQLSQAMGEGIVRAQEYNSLVENARPLLVAAANGLDAAGGSVAKLRKEVVDGKVTSEQFFQAVLDGGDILREQFGNTVPTIGQAMTVLNNAWTKFIGESAAGQAILGVVSGTLIAIAENFEVVATAVIGAGAAIVAYKGGGILGALISNTIRATAGQVALAGGFTASGIASAIAAGGVRAVTGAVRLLTAAVAANPLGLLLVGLVTLATYAYNARNAMVTVAGQTASLGAIIAEVWSRGVEVVTTFVNTALDGVSSLFNQVTGWFEGMGASAQAVGNFLIATFKSFVDVTIGKFRTLYNIAIGVFEGIARSGNLIFLGLQAAVTGQFDLAGQAFEGAFDGRTFNFDAAVASAAETATQVGQNFGRDFIGEAGAAIGKGKQAIAQSFSGVVADAAKRDVAGPTVKDFEFETINPGGTSGGAAGKKKKLNEAEKAYKDILDQQVGTIRTLTGTKYALNQALQEGLISQDQYDVRIQQVRTSLAEWATEGQNVAAAVREANTAILEMKIEAGNGSFADGFLVGIQRMTEGAANFTASAGSVFSDFFGEFTDGFANSVGQAIVYSEDLGSALAKVGQEAVAGLISALVKLGVQWLVNATIGQAIASAATAATTAQASAAAAAWAPAAALASLATSGANAAPANAAVIATLATTQALASAGRALALKDGGEVRGPGGTRGDKIPAMLSDREFVVSAAGTAPEGNLEILRMLNRGLGIKSLIPGLKNGGQVSTPISIQAKRDSETIARSQAPAAPPPAAPGGDTYLNVGISPQQIVEAWKQGGGKQEVITAVEEKKGSVKKILAT